MKRMSLALLLLLPAACSDDSPAVVDAPADVDAGAIDAGFDAAPGLLVEVPCDDVATAIYEAPADLTADKGTILRCTRDPDLSVEEIQAVLDGHGFSSRPLTSGANVYRVQYVTERGSDPPTPGFSSALVLLPKVPRDPALPVVVASHGSRGQTQKCAPSLADPSADDVRPDFERQVLPLVGYGYAVIAPDLAGHAGYGAPGNPPSAYAGTEDVGRSTLDGARALRNLIPSAVGDKVVLIGHSQGGHTALSALALAGTYGAGGEIAAVVTWAPLWLPQRTWGAILAAPGAFPFSSQPKANGTSLWYHYTHAELLDGAGAGVLLFKAEVRDQIKAFVDNQCWGPETWELLQSFGTDATSIFEAGFVSAVAMKAAGFATDCPTTEPELTLCETWMARYLADRPHLTGVPAGVPHLLFWGTGDATIPYDRITCSIERLRSDATNLTVCVEDGPDHNTILDGTFDRAEAWIAAHVFGDPLPDACALDESAILAPGGGPAACSPLPPND